MVEESQANGSRDTDEYESNLEVHYLGTAAPSAQSQQEIFETAVTLLRSPVWHDVPLPVAPTLQRGRAFVYASEPPRVEVDSIKATDRPSWGNLEYTPPETLEEFESSDFTSLISPFPDLWTIIPQPHLMTTPHNTSPDPPKPTTSPIRVASPFARSSLYVPVSGQPPFPKASAARIISNWPPHPGHALVKSSPDIIWTEKTLIHFWHFLIKVQEKGNCGPIGLSYQPSYLATVGRKGGRDWAFIKIYHPTVLTEHLLGGLRNFKASRSEGRRAPLEHALLGYIADDASSGVG